MRAHRTFIATGAAILVLALMTLTLIAAVTSASPRAASDAAATSAQPGGGWCAGGAWNGRGQWGGTGMWGMGFGSGWLTRHPEAMQPFLDLRAQHVQEMTDWWTTYGAAPTSDAAQQALNDLWQKRWNDLKDSYQQYADGSEWTMPTMGMWGGWHMGGMMGGWDASRMWGSSYGSRWLTEHPTAFGAWLALRDRQTADAQSWWQQHHAAPGSASARRALSSMRVHHRAEARGFYRHNDLSVTSSRMRSATGGWMGLGGMWGGWGW